MTSPTPTYGSQVQGGGIAVFDPNTGKALAGAGTYNPNTGLKIQQTPINANIIGNTMPIEIPQVNNTQAQTALGITANAAAQPENNPITEPQPVQESGSQSISQKIQELIGFQGTQGAATAQLQNEQGLTQKQQAVNDINTKITTTKKAYEDQIKEIRKNSEGKFAGAVEQDINNLTRVANEDLANLAIIQASANGNLQTAQEIVDTKIKAEFEPIQNQIASYTQLYNLVQNDLTESEKLAVQDQINTKNNDMQALLGAKKQAYDTALQNGAPANVLKSIGEATTPDMAYQAVGQYGVNKLDNQYKQAQIDKIYNDISSSGTTEDPANILAYAQQYASTGTIPTGMPKGTFGIMAQAAKELPKQDGSLVDTNTGVKSGKLSPTQEDGISALFDLSKKLTDLSSLYATSSTSRENKIVYSALRNEIVDLLARARTGAAISASEEALYKKKIPGTNKGIFTYNSPKKITGLQSSLQGKLNTMLNTNGLSLYGYSKVNIQGTDYTVGTIITNDVGDKGRVNPDGTITLIK